MKFKRYIREADMSRRDKISQMRQARKERNSKKTMSPKEMVQAEMNKYGKFQSIKNRIKDILDTYEEASSEVKLYTSISRGEDGSELYFPDDILPQQSDDTLSQYSVYISDNGESTWFGVDNPNVPLFFIDATDVSAVSDSYGGDDEDREDALNAFYLFVDNFDEIENWFYDYVEKKLQED